MNNYLHSFIVCSLLALSLNANAAFTSNASEGGKDHYSRPKGCFYVTYVTTDGKKAGVNDISRYKAPLIHVDAFKNITFKYNGSDFSHSWKYRTENPRTRVMPDADLTSDAKNLTFTASLSSSGRVPTLLSKKTESSAETEYRIMGWQSGTSSNSSYSNSYGCYLFGHPNMVDEMDVNSNQRAWCSSKYFGANNRIGTKSDGIYSYVSSGQVFGKNTHTRNFHGLATVFDYGGNPYLTRAVGVLMKDLKLVSGETAPKFKITIYRVNEQDIPDYKHQPTGESPDSYRNHITPGAVIAEKEITITQSYLEGTDLKRDETGTTFEGMFQFRFDAPIKIDGPIMVAFTGYNVSGVASGFTAFASQDYYDEGFGELGYVLEGAVGSEQWTGMNNLMANDNNTRVSYHHDRLSAPSLFLEVERPILAWQRPSDTGLHYCGPDAKEITLPLLSSRGYDIGSLSVVSKPDWVTISLADLRNSNGKYSNKTIATINVSALSQTVDGQETVVEDRTGTIVFDLDGCRTLEYEIRQSQVFAEYMRPQGCYYWCYTTVDGSKELTGWTAPRIHVDPFSRITFRNNSSAVGENITYTWKMPHSGTRWDFEKGSYTDPDETNEEKIEFTGKAISWNVDEDDPALFVEEMNLDDCVFGIEEMDTPSLSVSNGVSSSEFTFGGYDLTHTRWPAKLYSYPNHNDGVALGNVAGFERHAWMSSNFFGNYSNRYGSIMKGADTYPLIENGHDVGELFGKNSSAENYNGLGVVFEAPVNPYLVRAMGMCFARLSLASESSSATLTMKLYAIKSIPAYSDTESVTMSLDNAELLATSEVTVNKEYLDREFNTTNSAYRGLMVFPLDEMVNVNSAVFVTLEGYDVDAIVDFTSEFSCDYGDEGFGELGYIRKGASSETPNTWKGINNIIPAFRNVKTAPGLFIEIEKPFLQWAFTYENSADNRHKFTQHGESKTLRVYSSRGADSNDITVEAPNWIKVFTKDVRDQNGNYANKTDITIMAVNPVYPNSVVSQNRVIADEEDIMKSTVKINLNDNKVLEYYIEREGGILTGILDAAEGDVVKSIEYVNQSGLCSDKPFDGINMVITTFENGRKKIEKLINK